VERKSFAHLITGQDINEATGNSDESRILDDETLMENCGTNNMAARANALETQNDFVAEKVLSMSAERWKHILGRVFRALSKVE
jgi:hypothetical protein